VKVKIYTMDHCPYCERAKRLMTERAVPYEEERVPMDNDAKWDELEKRSGLKTMPQIFYGDRLIGGYSDLAALDAETKLKDLMTQ
jgi:glutaredoxin 3